MNKRRKFKSLLSCIISTVLVFSLFCLSGCVSGDSIGRSGGVFSGIVASGVKVKCGGNSPLNAEGKVTEIDGVVLKIPIDWSYAHSQQSDFKGNNWEGDDAYRGIGMFNCNENGDSSDKFKNSYSVNMRWEYMGYGYQDPGQYKTQGGYSATSVSIPDMVVGGTTAQCCSGGEILEQSPVDNINEYWDALSKAKIMVVNPVTGKACVCGPGFIPGGFEGTQWEGNLNWGGDPLFALGGITEAVSEAICDNGWKDIQPHTGDDNVALELFFVDEATPYGPCEFEAGSISQIKSTNKDRCGKKSNVDNSDAANLAVTASYDNNNWTYTDHEVVQRPTGSTSGDKLLPTTEKAIAIRKLATGDEKTADCGYFVASIVIMTLDKNYPIGGTSIQTAYMEGEGKDKWEYLGEYTYYEWYNSGEAQPADVLVNPEHTVMWVGYDAIKAQYGYITNESYCIVGASWDNHGPYIQTPDDKVKKYKVFRYTAEPDPNDNADELSSL